MKPIRRPQSLTEMATQSIRAAIVNGDLKLGAPLSEGQLAASLGISKTPVREALMQLRGEGLVTVVPQTGTFVFTLSAQEVVEICELRQTLEAAALRLAFQRHPDELLGGLREVVQGMTAARSEGDVRRYLALDSAFHEVMFRCCDNRYLADGYGRVAGKIAALRTHLAVKPGHTEKSYAEHREIVATVADGKLDAVLDILDRHIDRTKRTYTRNIADIAAADRGAAEEPAPRPPRVATT